MSVVKILVVVIVTTVVTLLCIRSGQAMAKTPVPAGTVYHTKEGSARDAAGQLLVVITTTNEPSSSEVPSKDPSEMQTEFPDQLSALPSNDSVEVQTKFPDQPPDGPSNDSMGARSTFPDPPLEASPNVTEGHASKNTRANGSVLQHSQATSRSLNTDAVHDFFAAGPSISRTGHYGKRPSYTADLDRGMSVDDDHAGEEGVAVVNTPVFHLNRPSHRQSNRYDYSTLETDISVAEEDGSTGYHNSYAANSAGGYRQTEAHAPVRPDATAANADGGAPGYYYYRDPRPVARPLPYMVKDPQLAPIGPAAVSMNMNMDVDNSLLRGVPVFGPLRQKFQDKSIDWQKIGILALFKVGLAKLKAFGFLKILFLLVFKLKLFLIAVFFKFLLLLKLMKFFKLLVLPMALMPLFGSLLSPMVLGSIIQLPFRLLSFLTEPTLAPATAYSAAASAAGLGLLSSPTVASPVSSATKLDEYTINRRRLESLDAVDPSLAVLRNVLDTEKCLERIACRMATAEKAGVMPFWISWFLRRITRFVPNKKLESYLRTFEETNNEIIIKSPSPANWVTWCSERYDCSINKNATKVTKTTL